MDNENVLDEKGRPLESPRPVALGQRREESSAYREKYASGLDVELRSDMEPNLVDDNIARLGFDSDRIKYDLPIRDQNAEYHPSIDTVRIGPAYGSSKDVLEHEVRHRGFKLLKDKYRKNPEWFENEYGKEATAVLLQLESELQTELRDNPDASFNTPYLDKDGNVIKRTIESTIQRIEPDVLRNFINKGAYLSEDTPNAGVFNRGFTNLDRAAQDMLTKAGEPPRAERREPESDGFWGGLKKAVGFAEGGLTMDDQMETVFKSSRGEVDPVSGNEVPLGARPEEVRDDIPANLSEGEYVVPADVLRYYGVKFFEDLRSQAKQGWQELDEGGRVGGDPSGMEMGEDELPFDISELQTIDDSQMGEQPEMNMGGYIKGYADGGVVDVDTAALQEEFPDAFTTAGKGGVPEQEYRTYTNAQGMTLSIRFVNGKPMSSIPAGYTASGETAAETAAPNRERKDRDTPTQQQPVERKDWATADASEFGTYLDQKESLLGKGVKAIAGGINPLMGALINYAGNVEDKRVLEALDNRLAGITDPKDPEYKKLMDAKTRLTAANEKDTIKDKVVRGTGIYGGGKSMTEGLKDTSGDDKVNFGDTYLGDLLGFDGSMGVDAKDAKGNTIGLAASVGGGRRDLDKKDTSPAPTTTTSSSNTSPAPTAPAQTSAPSAPTSNSTNSISGATSSGKSGDGNRGIEKESVEDKISRGGGFMNGGYVSKKSKKK